MSKKTTIRRANEDQPYTVIRNHTLQNNKLSWKAKGLLAYLLTLPTDWAVSIADLANRSTDGKHATRKAIEELMEAGHITRSIQHGEGGKFVGYEYLVYETPFTVVQFSDDGKTDDGKPHNTNYTDNKVNNKQRGKSENLPPEEEKESTDKFAKVEGLKAKIGPKHHALINEACQNEDTYQLCRSLYPDGRFNILMDWLEQKKKIRKGYRSSGGVAALIQQFSQYTTRELKEALSLAISNETQGIFPKKERTPLKAVHRQRRAV